MLSDAEQRRLTEIESGLRSADPGFVERFGRGARRGPYRWWRITAAGWLIVAALTMVLAMLTASAAIALIALSVAGVAAGWWLTDYSRADDGRPPRRP